MTKPSFIESHRNEYDGYVDIYLEDTDDGNIRRSWCLSIELDDQGKEISRYSTLQTSDTDQGDFGRVHNLPPAITEILSLYAGV